jgi:hypothetical protein
MKRYQTNWIGKRGLSLIAWLVGVWCLLTFCNTIPRLTTLVAKVWAAEYATCREVELNGAFVHGGAVQVVARACQRGGKWYLQ